jgi:hypothetical protein
VPQTEGYFIIVVSCGLKTGPRLSFEMQSATGRRLVLVPATKEFDDGGSPDRGGTRMTKEHGEDSFAPGVV